MTSSAPAPFRLFYVDDSGAQDTGYAVLAWIETTTAGWRAGQQTLLELRRDLYDSYKIPPAFELHATKFIAGRQQPSTDDRFNTSKQARREAAEHVLATIGACDDLNVGVVYRHTRARKGAYQAERIELYNRLISHLDTRLVEADEDAIVLVDGDGSDSSYHAAHRALKLGTRRIIEDPLFKPSHQSQWIQMADFTAWTAYQSVLRHPGKSFAWTWYDKHLRRSDIHGGPIEL